MNSKRGVKVFALLLGLSLSVWGSKVIASGSYQENARDKFDSNPYVVKSNDGGAYTIMPTVDLAKTWNNSSKNWSAQFSGVDRRSRTPHKYGDEIEVNGVGDPDREVGVGQHVFSSIRNDMIPVDKWVMLWGSSQCIHDGWTGFHGLDVNLGAIETTCYSFYYYGWEPICADCGEIIDIYHYTTDEAIKSMDYIDSSIDYFWLCPFNNNMEQGTGYNHECQRVSNNRYTIKYDSNATDNGGWMMDSIHYYNNSKMYNGYDVIPQTRLNKNNYARVGYVFTGWNTKADGTGTAYVDEEEVYNETDVENGEIKLYAQWRASESTLKVNPNGGKYKDASAATTYIGGTDITQDVMNDDVTPPSGYTVSFYTSKGSASPKSVKQDVEFNSWSRQENNGILRKIGGGVRYEFSNVDGENEELIAQYSRGSVTLAEVKNASGYFFVGWFDGDGNDANYVGTAGDIYIPTKSITLYAKFDYISLETGENYKSHGGVGAVDASWSLDVPDTGRYVYKLYRSASKPESIKKGAVLGEESKLLVYNTNMEEIEPIDEKWDTPGDYEWQVPYTGIYLIYSAGGQGAGVGSFSGGLGGYNYERLYLKYGTRLYIYPGSKGDGSTGYGSDKDTNGYGGAEREGVIGEGGSGSTVAYYGLKDSIATVSIAAGGGGASIKGDGRNGGDDGNTNRGKNGQNYGGGGGYNGGNAGTYVTHKHVAGTCTHLHEAKPTDAGYVGEIRGCYKYNEYPDKGTCTVTWVHTGDAANGNCTNVTPEYGDCNGKMSWRGRNWGQRHSVENCGGSSATEQYSWCTICGTTRNTNHSTGQSAGTHEYNKTTYSWDLVCGKSTTKGAYCEFEDGESHVTSADPSQGGTSYVNKNLNATDIMYMDSSMLNGINEGNGYVNIKSLQIGLQSELSLGSVLSKDKAQPNKVRTVEEALAGGNKKVTWSNPGDNGTEYWFQVEAYSVMSYGRNNSPKPSMTSNITKETLTSGVVDYLYVYDTEKHNIVESVDDCTVDTSRSLDLEASETSDKWVSIAARDKAGNISETTYVLVKKIGDGGDETEDTWPVGTTKVTIGLSDGVYKDPEEEGNTYFIRSDGKKEYQLQFEGVMRGTPRSNYQVDTNKFRITVNGALKGILKYTHAFINGLQETFEGSQVGTKGSAYSGSTFLSAGYRKVNVTEGGGISKVTERFTALGESGTVTVYPYASAHLDSTLGVEHDTDISSTDAEATSNMINLKLDGVAPVINGMTQFDNLIAGKTITITASDGSTPYSSGLKDLVVTVVNEDNKIKKEYKDGDDGTVDGKVVIKVSGNRDDPTFSGKVTAAAVATDNVGNVGVVGDGDTVHSIESEIYDNSGGIGNIFRRGERGILIAELFGYHERVEIKMVGTGYESEWVALDNAFNLAKNYDTNYTFNHSEAINFTAPIDLPHDGTYTVVIKGYKTVDGTTIEDKSTETVVVQSNASNGDGIGRSILE